MPRVRITQWAVFWRLCMSHMPCRGDKGSSVVLLVDLDLGARLGVRCQLAHYNDNNFAKDFDSMRSERRDMPLPPLLLPPHSLPQESGLIQRNRKHKKNQGKSQSGVILGD